MCARMCQWRYITGKNRVGSVIFNRPICTISVAYNTRNVFYSFYRDLNSEDIRDLERYIEDFRREIKSKSSGRLFFCCPKKLAWIHVWVPSMNLSEKNDTIYLKLDAQKIIYSNIWTWPLRRYVHVRCPKFKRSFESVVFVMHSTEWRIWRHIYPTY